MKKAIVGLAAVGALLAARPVAKRLVRQMHQRCDQMMAQFARGGEPATGT